MESKTKYQLNYTEYIANFTMYPMNMQTTSKTPHLEITKYDD